MEEEYKITLKHIVKWLSGKNEFDMRKPLSADSADKIRNVCIDVLSGKKLEQAIKDNTQ